MANEHKFWDRFAKRYAKSTVSDEAAYRTKLQKTRDILPKDAEVLEFGCGTGSTAIELAPAVKSYLATDISGNMLDIARGKAKGIGNLNFEQKRLEEVEPPEAGFDAVLGHSILHLMPEREAVIARVFELLKPGGVFVSSTMCAGNGGVLKLLLGAGNKIGLLPPVQFFSAEALEEMMVSAGFTVVERWRSKPKSALFLIVRKPL